MLPLTLDTGKQARASRARSLDLARLAPPRQRIELAKLFADQVTRALVRRGEGVYNDDEAERARAGEEEGSLPDTDLEVGNLDVVARVDVVDHHLENNVAHVVGDGLLADRFDERRQPAAWTMSQGESGGERRASERGRRTAS